MENHKESNPHLCKVCGCELREEQLNTDGIHLYSCGNIGETITPVDVIHYGESLELSLSD